MAGRVLCAGGIIAENCVIPIIHEAQLPGGFTFTFVHAARQGQGMQKEEEEEKKRKRTRVSMKRR
jgi:hypothetical protein